MIKEQMRVFYTCIINFWERDYERDNTNENYLKIQVRNLAVCHCSLTLAEVWDLHKEEKTILTRAVAEGAVWINNVCLLLQIRLGALCTWPIWPGLYIPVSIKFCSEAENQWNCIMWLLYNLYQSKEKGNEEAKNSATFLNNMFWSLLLLITSTSYLPTGRRGNMSKAIWVWGLVCASKSQDLSLLRKDAAQRFVTGWAVLMMIVNWLYCLMKEMALFFCLLQII